MINWLWFWWRCRRWCWFRNRMTCRFMTCHRCRRCLVIDFVVDATSLSSMKLISQSYGMPCHLMTCHGCRRRLSSLISVVILSLMIRRYHCRRWLWLWCRCRRWWCRCRRWCWFRNRMTVVLWRVIVVMVVVAPLLSCFYRRWTTHVDVFVRIADRIHTRFRQIVC